MTTAPRASKLVATVALAGAVVAIATSASSAPPPSGPPTSPSATPSPRPKIPVALADCRTAPADRTIEVGLQPIQSPLGVGGTAYASKPCPYVIVDFETTATPPLEVVLVNRLRASPSEQVTASRSKEACEGSESRVLLMIDGEVVDLAASKGVWNPSTKFCTLPFDETKAVPLAKKSFRVLASRKIAGAPESALGFYILRKPTS